MTFTRPQARAVLLVGITMDCYTAVLLVLTAATKGPSLFWTIGAVAVLVSLALCALGWAVTQRG